MHAPVPTSLAAPAEMPKQQRSRDDAARRPAKRQCSSPSASDESGYDSNNSSLEDDSEESGSEDGSPKETEAEGDPRLGDQAREAGARVADLIREGRGWRRGVGWMDEFLRSAIRFGR